MWPEKFHHLACPLDGLALVQYDNILKCAQGHSYDIAREAYVNLLPAQQKKSRDPGDSKAMIAARTRYLNAGFYQAIADRLDELTLSYLNYGQDLRHCLDAGCGDGYYLDHLHARILQTQGLQALTLTGLDISKWAIKAAAKRNRQITWIVGNSQTAPLKDQSVDILWSVFGFRHLTGFRKVMNSTAKLIMVDAGPDHLLELRKIIYPEIRQKHSETSATRQDAEFRQAGFRRIDQQCLSYQIPALSGQPLADLLLMTPHLYRASHAGKQAIHDIDQLSLTMDIRYSVFDIDPV